MKKLLFGLMALTSLNALAVGPATGANLTPANTSNWTINGGTQAVTKIRSITNIGSDAKSINKLSLIGNPRGTTPYWSPTGVRSLEGDIYVEEAAANLTNVKMITLRQDVDTSDFNAVAALATRPAANFSGPNAATDNTVDYNGSFVSNGTYFTYLLDMNTNKIYKTYYADGTRASYRVIKTADVDERSVADLTSGNYTPSNGYVTEEMLPQTATVGQVRAATSTDINSADWKKDPARWAPSGDTIHRHLIGNYAKTDASNLSPQNVVDWQEKLGVGPAQYNGVIGPKGTPKAEDRAVTGRTVYEYVEPLRKEIKEAKAGAAIGTAMANIPSNFKEGAKNTFGVGTGYFAGHSAVALGYQRRTDDNSFTFKVSTGFSTGGQFSAGAGAAFSW